MNPTEFYEEIMLSFPPLWPSSPECKWINVHDGVRPNVHLISEMLDQALISSEVVVLIHSEPGQAINMPRERAAAYLSKFVLKCDIQISDLDQNRFISISRQGDATSDA